MKPEPARSEIISGECVSGGAATYANFIFLFSAISTTKRRKTFEGIKLNLHRKILKTIQAMGKDSDDLIAAQHVQRSDVI